MYSGITREGGRGKRRVKDVRGDFEVLSLSKQADSGAIYRVAVVSSYVSLKPPNTRVKLDHMSPLEHTLLFSSMFHCPFPSFLHFQTLDIVQDSKPMFYSCLCLLKFSLLFKMLFVFQLLHVSHCTLHLYY